MKDYLPIGSIVLLQGATKKTMIIGILHMKEAGNERIYDYLGVPYPEGFMGKSSAYLFDHEHIENVIFVGYSDPERQNFIEFISHIYKASDETIREVLEKQQQS